MLYVMFNCKAFGGGGAFLTLLVQSLKIIHMYKVYIMHIYLCGCWCVFIISVSRHFI